MLKSFLNDESGQGMVEYILIVALIAVAAIVGVRMFGDNISALFTSSANKIADENR